MMRIAIVCVALVGAACDGEIGGGGIDAAVDGALDAAADAAVCRVELPACAAPTIETARCEAAVVLEAGTPRTAQDSGRGGYGDCAMSGSGLGGPSLYYRVTVPAGRLARVEAVPDGNGGDALVRAFASCAATESEHSGRGGAITQGKAAVCLRPEDGAAREYVIAVSRYSGEFACVAIGFDVSIDVREPDEGCQEIE